MRTTSKHSSRNKCKATSAPALSALCMALALALAMPAAPVLAANSGGVADYPAPGDYTGSLDGATITSSGGRVTIDSDVETNVFGGYSGKSDGDASTNNNAVTMIGGKVGSVTGGYSYSTSGNASSTGNSVTISGGTVNGSVHGGSSSSDSGNASSTGNSVIISGGTIERDVYGGNSYSNNGNANASGNSVVISGGTIRGKVYGGFSSNISGNTSTTGNSVTLMGAPVFGENSDLNGGTAATASGTAGEARSNNTLNMFAGGIRVRTINNFQHYNFALPTDGRVGLTVTDAALMDGRLTASISVPHALPGGVLRENQKVTLLHSDVGLIFLQTPEFHTVQVRQGISFIYDYTLAKDANSIWATITRNELNPQSGAVTQGRAAGLAFANLGSDLAAGAGMDAMRGAAYHNGLSSGSASGYGLVPFFAAQGSALRYSTGANTDVNGFAMMTGLAKKWQAPSMDILAGVFFEAAFGNYSSRNNFTGTGGAKGKGDTHTLGGGILVRLDMGGMTDTALRGLYAEASLRVGSLSDDYTNNDLRDFTGSSAAYDVNTLYYGAHAGLGYIWNLTERASLDMYGKYFWTHQQGKSVSVLGDTFKLQGADSHRTRLGGRLAYAVTESISPYLGAAWEYELDGKSRATVYGYDVPAPSLKGSTGIGEVGLVWKPGKNQGLAVNLGLQGYTGMRKGVSGSLQLKYEF